MTEQEPIVYVNGAFVPGHQATVSVFDHVVLYGDGVFDTMCCWNHAVFKLDQHVDRLFESAHAVMLTVPHTRPELRSLVLETVRRNRLRNAYVKVIVTRGVGPEPLLNPHGCVPGVIIFAVPYLSLTTPARAEAGIRMIVSSMRRVPNESMSTRIKSCNYLNHVLMRIEANQAGADDAIELDTEGYVCEAPGYNVFVMKRGRLTTPADNILRGITRAAVLELAAAAGISAALERVQPFDLYNADEVFLSSTAGGIVPVVALDGRVIGTGKPGPVTRLIGQRYEALLETGVSSTPVEVPSRVP